MAMPNRKQRKNKKPSAGKGKRKTLVKAKKDMKISRIAIKKLKRKASKRANGRIISARLSAAGKRSARDGAREATALEQYILSSVGKRVHFDADTEAPVKNGIDNKKKNARIATRASIPRKAEQTRQV